MTIDSTDTKAWDCELERQVALKVLSPDVSGDRTRLERFVREVKDASALNHPDTLTVYDAGQSDAVSFIVTEYVDGVKPDRQASRLCPGETHAS